MLARSGTYTVQSRVIDDDQHVWLDVEWGKSGLYLADYRIQACQGVVDIIVEYVVVML
jgi:hypothetical protein